MARIQNVAVLGGSGNVSKYAIPALQSAGFTVTIIARPDSTATYPPDITVKHSKYDDLEALSEVFRGQDAVVEAFNPSAAKDQATIVQAALNAGVSRLLTPEFSTDSFSPHASEIRIFEPKHAAQRELEALTAAPDCPLTWTAIIVGPWFDWAIGRGLFWINKENRTVTRFGSGNQKVSFSRVSLAGEAIVAVLQQPDQYRNRVAYFADHTVSTNELIAVLESISPPSYWEVVDKPIDNFKGDALQLWEEDTKRGVENRLGSQAYVMLGTVALLDEENRYDGDYGRKIEPGFGRSVEELKETLRQVLGFV